jgi:hypothetical protein
MDVSQTGWSVSRTWRDEHDARLPLTRANLHSQNDLTVWGALTRFGVRVWGA